MIGGPDRAKAIRLNLARCRLGHRQQLSGIHPAEALAGPALEPRGDLPRLRVSASIELGDEVAHQTIASRLQQIEEGVGVVPVRRRLALVRYPGLTDAGCDLGPSEWVVIGGKRGAEPDFDSSPDREVGRADLGDGCSVSCGMTRMRRFLVQTSRRPSEASTAPATTRRPLPSAPRVGRRKSFDETIGRSIENSVATSSGSIPGPSSSTKYPPPSISPTTTSPPASSALSANSLRTRRRSRRAEHLPSAARSRCF